MTNDVEVVAELIALGHNAAFFPEGTMSFDAVEVEPWHREIARSVMAFVRQRNNEGRQE